MAFPSTGILDNFDRSNTGPPLGGNWTQLVLVEEGFKIINNTQAQAGGSSVASGELWTAATYAETEVYFSLVTVNKTSDYLGVSVLLRVVQTSSSSTIDGYTADFVMREAASNVNVVNVIRIDNGVNTQLGATISSVTLASGDAVGASISGSTIKVFRKPSGGSWAQVGTDRSDATYSAAGNIGWVWWWNDPTDTVFDNFGGGTIVVASSGNPYYAYSQQQ